MGSQNNCLDETILLITKNPNEGAIEKKIFTLKKFAQLDLWCCKTNSSSKENTAELTLNRRLLYMQLA